MKLLIKIYFAASSFVFHLLAIVVFVKLVGSFDSLLSFIEDAIDQL